MALYKLILLVPTLILVFPDNICKHAIPKRTVDFKTKSCKTISQTGQEWRSGKSYQLLYIHFQKLKNLSVRLFSSKLFYIDVNLYVMVKK